MAVQKIEAGTKIVTVAKEIGAGESLVAKGARAELPELPRRGRPQGKAPQFVEVRTPSEPARQARQKSAADAAACQIRIGDAEILLRGDLPTGQLAGILRRVEGLAMSYHTPSDRIHLATGPIARHRA